jgi:tetratricopeptide (TPR) repeat protein
LGILLLILRRLPETASTAQQAPSGVSVQEKLLAKGLPAEAFSKVSTFLKFWTKKIWNFVLEAKDLKPHVAAGYRMQKIFNGKPAAAKTSTDFQAADHEQEEKNEQYYLDKIRQQPKNFSNFDLLGKFYLENSKFSDAGDIYEYLANHQPGNPEFQARLGYCYYQNREFAKAAEHYQKSLALDSTQPNRYYNLGLSLEAVGNLAESVKKFETAIALEPSAKYYVSLSTVYLKLNNGQKAREVLLKARELEPQNETVKNKLDKLMLPAASENKNYNF